MKIACQTITWGARLEDPVAVFQTIAELGFDGVEIAQGPPALPAPLDLRAILDQLGLEFVGFHGGSLGDRMEYCREYRPRYLVIDYWDEPWCGKAQQEGFTLALYPHAYSKTPDLKTASRVVAKQPRLKLLPCTAHLFLAHENPVEAIVENVSKLAAIHIKDWTPKYGRSFHRYARGFVELGNGIVPLEEVVHTLHQVGFDGWIVVKQDSTAYGARESVQISARWLSDHGLPMSPRQPKGVVPRPAQRPEIARGEQGRSAFIMDSLLHTRAQEIQTFCARVLTAFCELSSSRLATLWEFSLSNNLLSLLACLPFEEGPIEQIAICSSNALSGMAVESQAVCHLDVRKPYGEREFEHPELVEKLGLSEMISIPILNTYNLNHVELVINLYPKEGHEGDLSDSELAKCADYVAIAYEALIEDACQSAASAVNLCASGAETSDILLDEIVRNVRSTVSCETVAIFLVDDAGKKLELRASTGTEWSPNVSSDRHYYLPGEGLDGTAWQTCKPLLIADPSSEQGYLRKSWELVAEPIKSCLISPLMSPSGNVTGVLRCGNKHSRRRPDTVIMFSESDLSVIDAIWQAASSHLSVLFADERRARTLALLTHELKVPLVAMRGAAEFIRKESKENGFGFSYSYVEDILSWHDLTRRLLDNVDFFRRRADDLQLRIESVCLLADVFGPAREQIVPLLRERRFSICRIVDDRFIGISRAWIDRNQFEQVFFNLLSNSVKYAHEDPNAFQVEVRTGKVTGGYEVLFRDWGLGIPDGYSEVIFRKNVRGPNAEQFNVAGDGLGLWIVAEIVRAHGGNIVVSNRVQPTEFRIWLPEKISKPWEP